MPMNRTDLEGIAAILRDTKPSHDPNTVQLWNEIVVRLAMHARERNPRFNADIFKQACEFPAEV